MEVANGRKLLLDGLDEFREHMGGLLTITLLTAVGNGEEVHQMDTKLIGKACEWLQQYCLAEQKK